MFSTLLASEILLQEDILHNFNIGVFFICTTFYFALILGKLLQYLGSQRAKQKIYEFEIEQNQEKINLMKVTHDSIANKLTNIIILSRDIDPKNYSSHSTIIQTLAQQSLSELREKVITPLKSSINKDFLPSYNNKNTELLLLILHNTIQNIESELKTIGFQGPCTVTGSLLDLNQDLLQDSIEILHEIRNNIIKHGSPPIYSIDIHCSKEHIEFWSSNKYIDSTTQNQEGIGLLLIQKLVDKHHGTMKIDRTDNWTIYIKL